MHAFLFIKVGIVMHVHMYVFYDVLSNLLLLKVVFYVPCIDLSLSQVPLLLIMSFIMFYILCIYVTILLFLLLILFILFSFSLIVCTTFMSTDFNVSSSISPHPSMFTILICLLQLLFLICLSMIKFHVYVFWLFFCLLQLLSFICFP